jgi:hypothetical protein
MTDTEDFRVPLLLSAQRALLGSVPASLRAASLELRGSTVHLQAVFSTDSSDGDRELLSAAAAEIIRLPGFVQD